jgi:hypothetical protein
MGAEASSMAYGGRSAFVPSVPVWECVRRRQAQLGLTDDELCDALAWHPKVVDARPGGLMLRSTATMLLRNLAELGEPQPPRRAIDAGKATSTFAVA